MAPVVLTALFLGVAAAATGYIYVRVIRPRVEPRYEFALLAPMANEGPYIQEWLRWHILQGAEHFFLYDNDPEELDYEKFFGKEMLAYITVIPWKNVRKLWKITPQRLAYRHCMRRYARLCRWLAVVDIDEFVSPAPGSPHTRVVDVLRDLPPNIAWLEVMRWDFGYRPHEKRPDGDLMDNYLWRAAEPPKLYWKSVVNGSLAPLLDWNWSVHNPRWQWWLGWVAKRYWRVQRDDDKALRISHYYTKSLEEWDERSKRLKERARFNVSRARFQWGHERLDKYNEVHDDHALQVKARLEEARGDEVSDQQGKARASDSPAP